MNKLYFNVDLGLLIPALVLVTFGASGIFSINLDLFKAQLVFFLISLLAFFIFSQINYQSIQNFHLPIYLTSLFLLVILLFIGIESRGTVRWVDLFGFRIQFTEILKPFLLLAVSSYLTDKENYKFSNFVVMFLLIVPIFILIFLQPDLGNASIYLITFILILFTYGFPLRYFLGLLASTILFLPFFWTFLRTYQKQRILTFLQLKDDPLGTSYNAIQSVIAVGSGMVLGKGFGQGTQSVLRFLPERHTDFIFATLSEELGLIGSVVIIGSFSFMIFRIISISRQTNDTFVKLFAMCCFFLLIVQFFVNAGMNIGIVPIVGVSLPFVSYGGSSLLSNFILLGLLSSMGRSVKMKETLEIR